MSNFNPFIVTMMARENDIVRRPKRHVKRIKKD